MGGTTAEALSDLSLANDAAYEAFKALPLGERAYRHISLDIISCAIAPGAILSANEFAERLGISRTPVSLALARLEDEGLVQSLPRLGYRVSDVSADDLREIFQCRVAFEPVAASLAIGRASDAELKALEDAVSLETATLIPTQLATVDLSMLTAGRELFHHKLAELSGNSRLRRTITGLINESHRAAVVFAVRRIRSGGHRPVASDHGEIVKAMLARDAEAAQKAMQVHLIGLLDEILSELRPVFPGSKAQEGRRN